MLLVFIRLKCISFGIVPFFWLNVELCLRAVLFKSSTGSGRHKRETAERTDRHHTSHYVIDCEMLC